MERLKEVATFQREYYLLGNLKAEFLVWLSLPISVTLSRYPAESWHNFLTLSISNAITNYWNYWNHWCLHTCALFGTPKKDSGVLAARQPRQASFLYLEQVIIVSLAANTKTVKKWQLRPPFKEGTRAVQAQILLLLKMGIAINGSTKRGENELQGWVA